MNGNGFKFFDNAMRSSGRKPLQDDEERKQQSQQVNSAPEAIRFGMQGFAQTPNRVQQPQQSQTAISGAAPVGQWRSQANERMQDMERYQQNYDKYMALYEQAKGARQGGDMAAYYDFLGQRAGAQAQMGGISNKYTQMELDAQAQKDAQVRERLMAELRNNRAYDSFRIDSGMNEDEFYDWFGRSYEKLGGEYQNDTLDALYGQYKESRASRADGRMFDTGGLEDEQRMYQDMSAWAGMSEAEKGYFEDFMRLRNNLHELTPEQRAEYDDAEKALTQGRSYEELDEIAQGYQRFQDREGYLQRQGEHRAEVEEHPFWANIKSVGASLAGGIPGALTAAGDALQSDWNRANAYAEGYMLNQYSADVKSFTGESIDNAAVRTLYNAGMSTLENGARILATSLLGVPDASLALMAMGSYGQSYQEAAMRGATPMQATMFAGASAALEVITEKVSLDNLLEMKNPNSIIDILKNAAVQGAVEISEEEASFFGGIIADALIMGDKAELAMQMQELVDSGMTQEKAAGKVLWGVLQDAAKTAVESWLSGAMMAGAEQTVQYGRAASLGRDIKQDAPAAFGLQETAQQFGEDTEAYQRAQGITLADSNAAWGNLAFATENQMQEQATAQEKAQSYVQEAVRRDVISDKVAGILASNPEYRAALETMTGESITGETAAEKAQSVRDAISVYKEYGAAMEEISELGKAQRLGEAGREAMQENFDGKSSGVEYARAFRAYYNAGLAGAGADTVRASQDALTQAQRDAAYQAGQRDKETSRSAQEGRAALQTNRKDAGLDRASLPQSVSRETGNTIDRAAKALGVRVRFAEMAQEANGYIDSDGTIVLNAKGERAAETIFAHEITHRIQDLSPIAYGQYRDHVLSAIAQESGSGIDKLIEDTVASYAEGGVELSQEEAMDEMAADYAIRMMEDTDLFRSLAQENQGLAKRLWNSLKALVRKLRDVFSGGGDQITAYGTSIQTMEKAVGLWEKALQEAAGASGKLGAEDGGESENTRRYSFVRAKSSDIQQAEKMEDGGADRAEIWNKLGIIRDTKGNWVTEIDDSTASFHPSGDAELIQSKEYAKYMELLNKILGGGMSEAEEKQLMEYDEMFDGVTNEAYERLRSGKTVPLKSILSHPALFSESPGLKEVRVRFADLPNGTYGSYDPMFETITISNAIADFPLSSLLHEIQHVLQHRGLRPGGSSVQAWTQYSGERLTPGEAYRRYQNTAGEIEARETERRRAYPAERRRSEVPDLGWDIAIQPDAAYGRRFSISNKDSEGRTLSSQQRAFFKDSKILDEDGNLRVVYHGTDADFTVFDPSKGRSTMDIQGMFFSPWDDDARGYGGKVGEYYLNIKNPAPENIAYKALHKYTGQNNAGARARADLERMGYDGVNNGDEEYIAFYPEQVKRTNNKRPTASQDIRYSVEKSVEISEREKVETKVSKASEALEQAAAQRDGKYEALVNLQAKGTKTEADKEQIRALRSEVAALNADVNRRQGAVNRASAEVRVYAERNVEYRRDAQKLLKKTRALQEQANQKGGSMDAARKGFTAMQADVRAARNQAAFDRAVRTTASDMRRRTGSLLTQEEANALVRSVYAGYARGGLEGAQEAAETAARSFVDTAMDKTDSMYDSYSELRSTARGMTLVVSPEVANSITDFADWRKRNMDRMNVRVAQNRGEENLDTTFSEWAGYWPELLDAETPHGADQLFAIEGALEAVYADRGRNPYAGYEDEAVQELAANIVNGMVSKAAEKRDTARALEKAEAELEKARETARKAIEGEQAARRVAGNVMEASLRAQQEAQEKAEAGWEALREEQTRREEERLENSRVREANAEDRKKAEAQRAIFKKAEKFRDMALKPRKGDTVHAPKELLKPLAHFCDTILGAEERYYESTAAKLAQREAALEFTNEALGESKTRAKEAQTIQNLRERLDRNRLAAAELHEAYHKLSENAEHMMYYDEFVDSLLAQLQWQVKDKPMDQMTSFELNEILNTMKAMEYVVENSNKVFSAGKDKTLVEINNGLLRDMGTVKPAQVVAFRRYMQWQMSPDTFFNYICGFHKDNMGQTVQGMFSDGTERMLLVQQEFYKHFAEFTETGDKKTLAAVRKLMGSPMKQMVSWGLKNANGENVETSIGMMLQAYMLLSQKASFDSIVYGGFKIPNQKAYYGGKSDAAYGDAEENQLLSEAVGEEHSALVRQIQDIEKELETHREIAEAPETSQLSRARILEGIKSLEAERDELRRKADKLIHAAEQRCYGIKAEIERVMREQMPDLAPKLIEAARNWYKRAGVIYADTFEGMYGYRPNLVENYTPIHRDLGNVKTDARVDMAGAAFNLENSGMTKERVRSVAPIKLTDFFQELSGHTQQVGRYAGFAAVQKDFNRILNVKIPGSRTTVKTVLAAKFGQGKTVFGVSGEMYVDNYIKSVSGASKEQDVMGWLYGASAAATLSLNPRVALSQAASVPTASAVVGWGSMARGFAKGLGTAFNVGGRKTQLANDSIWFWNRWRGAGSTEFADLKTGGVWDKAVKSKVGKALMGWCQAMDAWSTASMWAMAEDYVQHNGVSKGDPGYQKAVEKCYADIIRRSQPNYTETERSDLLRDRRMGGMMKLLTMYKTQSNQNMNLLMNSIGEYRAAVQDLKSGAYGVTREDVTNARRRLTNSVTAVTFGGTMLFVVMRTLVNAAMGKMDPYRDEETNEVNWAGIAKGMAKEAGSSIAGMFALGSQFYDYVFAALSGERYYGLSDSAMSNLSAVLEKTNNLIQKAKDPDKDVTWTDVEKAVSATMTVLGVPYNNAKSFMTAFRGWAKGKDFWKYESDKTTVAQYGARIAQAWTAGDTGKVDDTLALLASRSNKDTDAEVQKDVRSKVTAQVKNQYDAGKLYEDQAAALLAYVYADGGSREEQEAALEAAWSKVHHWQYAWDTGLESVSEAYASKYYAYIEPADIPAEVYQEAYAYKKGLSGSIKEPLISYIASLPLTRAQKKAMWDALKNAGWAEKDLPW